MTPFEIQQSVLFIALDQVPVALLGDIDEPYNFMPGDMNFIFKQNRLPLQEIGFRAPYHFAMVVTKHDLDDLDAARAALRDDIERLRHDPAIAPENRASQIFCRKMLGEFLTEKDSLPPPELLAAMPGFVKNAEGLYDPPPQIHYKSRSIATPPFARYHLN